MKQKIFTLLVLMTFSAVSVLGLYWLSKKRTSAGNGFERTISGREPTLLRSVNLNSDLLYFAGWLDGNCYLANPETPFEIIEVIDTSKTTIWVKHSPAVRIRVGKLAIDSPYFFLADLYTYKVYRGKSDTWRVHETIPGNDFFSEVVPMRGSSLILRTLNEDKTTYTLLKKNLQTKNRLYAAGLLEKQIDGLFCTDGMLLSDDKSSRIIYTYFYRNEFICADTNLNLLLRGNSIDTISHARIKVASIPSMGVTTLASPPFLVNRATCASNGQLFINSNMIADNENPGKFNTCDVIDIYDTSAGDYLLSFYIPRQNGERIRHLAVNFGLLYVLRGTHLDVYKLPAY